MKVTSAERLKKGDEVTFASKRSKDACDYGSSYHGNRGLNY